MPFSIIALQSNVTRIYLEGDLDASSVEGLRPELRNVARRSPPRIEMDLRGLRSIDPRGVAALLSFVGSAARLGCRITLTGLRDQQFDGLRSTLASAISNAPVLN